MGRAQAARQDTESAWPQQGGPGRPVAAGRRWVNLVLKEGLIPRRADKVLFWLAPAVSVVPVFVSFAVIPFGPEVSIFGVRTPLQLTHLPVAVLLVLAMSSVGVYGIVLAGWSSPSTYSLRGWLRSCAQVVSSEIGEFACAGGETVYQGVSLSCRRDILSFRHLAKAAALSGAAVPL